MDSRVSNPEKRAGGRSCRWLGRSILLLVSTLVSLGVGEVYLRSRPATELGFEYVDGEFRGPPEFVADVYRNRFGFHDLQPGPKDPTVPRVLLLGDSYVAALSVPIEKMVGQRLGHHLRTRSREVEVVSLGKPGWGQVEQLSVLRDLGPFLKPDFVLTLFLPFNDVRDNHAGLDEESDRELSEMSRFRPGWSRLPGAEVPLFWAEHSRLNQLLSFRLFRLMADSDDDSIPIDYFVYSTATQPQWEEAWEQTRSLLTRTKRLAKKLGAGYAIVSASTPHGVYGAEAGLERLCSAYPAMNDLEWDLDAPNRKLAEFCKEKDIPFLSLEPLFRQNLEDTGERMHWEFDGHWNERGNDFGAERIAEFLQGLL